MTKTKIKTPRLTGQEKEIALRDGVIAAIKMLRARSAVSLRDASEIVRDFLGSSESTMGDVRRAKAAFDAHRSRNEALGMEVCMVVVGYVSGRDPFRLIGRVSADLGESAMPDPPLSMTEMQPVAFAAKMAFAKALAARRRKGGVGC